MAPREEGVGSEALSDAVPIPSPLHPSQAFPCISTGVFGEWGHREEEGRSGQWAVLDTGRGRGGEGPWTGSLVVRGAARGQARAQTHSRGVPRLP